MMHTFPLSEYYLTNGNIFRPSDFPTSELSLRSVLPDYEVSQDELVKVLYNYQGTPVTLSGHWDSKSKRWMFDGKFGMSEDGKAAKELLEIFNQPKADE